MHWSILIDVVQLVGCQTPLHGQAVDKSGSGKIRAKNLDMSRCWALPFCCPLVADLQRTSCRQVVDMSISDVVQIVYSLFM